MNIYALYCHELQWPSCSSCQPEVCGYGFGTMGNQNPSVDNQNDLFMHCLVMSYNAQVVMNGCSGQVSF
jgi:hypothetical protein